MEMRPTYQQIKCPMSEFELAQLQLEITAWRRGLHFMMEENIAQKERLSDSLRKRSEPEFLEEAEQFLSRFIRKDLLIGILRSDLSEVDGIISQSANSVNPDEVRTLVKKVRNDIHSLERQFSKLRYEFNVFLSEPSNYT
jgi:hypothetical protein